MPKDDNSLLGIIYQVAPDTPRNLRLLRMIESILEYKSFDYLRTEEQLGHSVGLDVVPYASVLHLSIGIFSQGNKNSYADVILKMNFFMNEVAKKAIDELSNE